MMKVIRKIQRSIIFFIKIVMFICLFLAFFGPYFPKMSEHLFRLNRVTAITASTLRCSALLLSAYTAALLSAKRKAKGHLFGIPCGFDYRLYHLYSVVYHGKAIPEFRYTAVDYCSALILSHLYLDSEFRLF